MDGKLSLLAMGDKNVWLPFIQLWTGEFHQKSISQLSKQYNLTFENDRYGPDALKFFRFLSV
jgi:hypothetical protein